MIRSLVEMYQRDFPKEPIIDGGDTIRAGHCPFCGHREDGKQGDRFRIFKRPDTTGRFRWLCNYCGKSGDTIDYLNLVRGLSFVEARRLCDGNNVQNPFSSDRPIREERKDIARSKVADPTRWQSAAQAFVAQSQAALSCPQAQAFYQGERFLTFETVRACGLGWNTQTIYPLRRSWGMSERKQDDKFCIPAGAVLPLWHGEKIASIEVRCVPAHTFQGKDFTHWHVKNETRTFILRGSGQVVALFESILDAALAWQASNREMSVVALTGSAKSFDEQAIELIESVSVVVGVPDNDSGGQQAFLKWRGIFPQIQLRLSLGGKDLRDAHRQALQGEKAFTAEQWYQLRVRPLFKANIRVPERCTQAHEAEVQDDTMCRDCQHWQCLSMCRGYCHQKNIETSAIARCGKVAGIAC